MAESDKISDVVLMHLRQMTPEQARSFLGKLATEAVAEATTRAQELDDFGLTLAPLNLAQLEEKLAELKPNSPEWRRVSAAHLDALQLAAIPRGPNPVKLELRNKVAAELSAELAKLSEHPTANYQKIRELSSKLAETLKAKVD